MITHDIVVIGGGPAGMAAAVAAYDAGVSDVVILDREDSVGGILRQCIHNGFGLHKLSRELTGPEYADVYRAEVEKRGIKVLCETTVTAVSADRVVTARSREGILKIGAGAVVLAMGCRERSRGALNISGTRPAGVYSAGTAQKLINCEGYMVGRRVVILGSGDIGLIMARRMSLEGGKVEAVCEIMPYSGGLTRNIVQCLEDYGIPLYLSTTVAEIHGGERVTGVTVAEVDERRQVREETKRYIPCDTLLLSVGLIPENELSKTADVTLDRVTNGAVVDQDRQTSTEGIFACGNVLHVHDLVDYVSEEAEIAGASAAAYIRGESKKSANIPLSTDGKIRYTVPQTITQEKELRVYFRVADIFRNATIKVSDGERVIYSKKKQKLAPGEMECITLKPDQFVGASALKFSLEVE